MTGVNNGFTTLLRDSAGNVLPMAAVGMVMLAALVGGGIDMSRAYRVENRLQSACDAAALAGRRAVESDGYTDAAKSQAKSYFDTNFDEAAMETTKPDFTSTSDDNGQTVKATASTSLNLAVMQIFGFKKFDLAVECEASMGVGNSDVMMVLDSTGSMKGSRIRALRTAMKNFYRTVATATQGTNARIRYGFVPYSSSVNVGRLLMAASPDYLVDTWSIYSREPEPVGAPDKDPPSRGENVGRELEDTTNGFTSKRACEAQLDDTLWLDVGEPTTWRSNEKSYSSGYQTWTTTERQYQARVDYTTCYKSGGAYYRKYYNQVRHIDTSQDWRMAYKPLAYDVTAYKAFQSVRIPKIGDYGTTVSSAVWKGCIEERDTVAEASFSFATLTGITPAGAKDLDIDSAPTFENDTKWAPMWSEPAFRRTGDTTGEKPPSDCPTAARLLAEMTQEDFDDYADSLVTEGNTYLDIGMAWGARLSSPDGIFKDNVTKAPSNGGEVSRHLIFMSDGLMQPANTHQTAWGIERNDKRVTDDGWSGDASRHSSRFLALCEAVKAKGIRVWTIYFNTGTDPDMRTCATTGSYFNASNSTQLNAAFQEIAKQVGELRLTQ